MESKKRLIVITLLLVFVSIVSMVGAYFFLQSKLSSRQQTVSQSQQQQTINPIFGSLPQTFPHDMPLLPDAEVGNAKETDTNWSAVFLTTRSVDQAQQFYQTELAKSGWQIDNTSQAAGLTILSVSKNNTSAIISIGKGDRGTTVSITILKAT